MTFLAEVWCCGTMATYITLRLRFAWMPLPWVVLHAMIWPRTVTIWLAEALLSQDE